MSRFYTIGCNELKISLVVLLTFFTLFVGRQCRAEELQRFMDGDPLYPLVYAREFYLSYLDLDSCTIISDGEDGFEFSVEKISTSPLEYRSAYRFRQNAESAGELQVFGQFYANESVWRTIPDPRDWEAIEEALDEKGRMDFYLDEYYMFRIAYQHLFGVPYEDGRDEKELERTLIIWPEGDKRPKWHWHLWNNKNYVLVYTHDSYACYLDTSSVFVEEETDEYCILRGIYYGAPICHYNDILPDDVSACSVRYEKEDNRMSVGSRRSNRWHYMPPGGITAETGKAMPIGEAMHYLVYGDKFYGYSDAFYGRLDGMGIEQ